MLAQKDVLNLNYDFNRFNSTIKFLHITNVINNLLNEYDDNIFISEELLNTLAVSIDEIKENMNINVTYQYQHFNYKTKTWVEKKGYWIRKNK